MDELKLQTNVKCCAESTVICYIFSLMHGKNSVCNSIIRVFQLVDLGVLFELVKGMEIKS
jgi:hypothetical protein